KIRFEAFHEGLSAQIMHIGPYSAEGPTVEKLHSFIKENGYELRGKHHEVYLSDPRRAAPEKMRTVIRQPVTAPAP
ncbi:MAG: GyrI-like domain-containing protein, partial [Candidatus Bipolaricaulia bacterium]